MSESNAAAEAGMVRLGKEQGQRLDAVIGKGSEWSATLDRRAGEGKRTRDGAFKVSDPFTRVRPFSNLFAGHHEHKCHRSGGLGRRAQYDIVIGCQLLYRPATADPGI